MFDVDHVNPEGLLGYFVRSRGSGRANISTGVAKGLGDVGEQVFAVAAAGAQLHRKGGFALDIPLHLQQALGVFGDAADIGAIGAVDSDAAAAGDQADDAVAGNGGAALAEADHQILHALNADAAAVAAAEYTAARGLFGRDFADDLAHRHVAAAQGGMEVLRCCEPEFCRDLVEVGRAVGFVALQFPF